MCLVRKLFLMIYTIVSVLRSLDLSTDDVISNEEYIVTEVNIKAVGDCLMHNGLIKQGQSKGFSLMFDNIRDEIHSADLAIINQETIFIEDENEYSGYPRFGSPFGVGDAIIDAGFDIVTHATNHTADKGIKGIQDTLNFWSTNYPNFGVLGIHDDVNEPDIHYEFINRFQIGFLNYTYGLNGLDYEIKGHEYLVDRLSDSNIDAMTEEARYNSDLLIVLLHVGDEYVYTPSSYAVKQVDRFIDLGADVVICTHPHIVQGFGIRETASGNTGLVYYSLGNFISQQDKEPRAIGGMADFTFKRFEYPDGSWRIELSDYNMKPLVTHMESGNYTTYLLEDYTEKLLSKHRLFKDRTAEELWGMYNKFIDEAKVYFK